MKGHMEWNVMSASARGHLTPVRKAASYGLMASCQFTPSSQETHLNSQRIDKFGGIVAANCDGWREDKVHQR